MKGIHAGLGRALILAAVFTINHSHAQTGGFAVTQRGADWRVLSKTTVEHGTNRVHQYTELATGLNYTNNYGQLTESKEQITILPQGGAAATQGRHKVYFPADIYNGVLEVVTPDGKHLKSRPLGVSYDDGSNTVFIAELKHAQGYLTSSNTVTYRDAFTGFKADLVCTYRRGGFECDLVFREQPPAPDQFGLDNSFSTLQLVTEFFNTQDPQEVPAAYDDNFGLQDTTLKFGKLTMTQGRAFAFKGTNSISPRPRGGEGQGAGAVPVYKSWLHLQGRTFLIEQLPLLDIADDLDALPLTAQNRKSAAGKLMAEAGSPTAAFRSPSSARRFPPAHEFVADTNQLLLAAMDLKQEPGVVLDYNEVDSSYDTFTFESGQTYLISGNVYIGQASFNGAILKYDSGAALEAGSIGSSSWGDVFTVKDDNSAGEAIDGSSGSPAFDWSDWSKCGLVVDNADIVGSVSAGISFNYLNRGVSGGGVQSCQFNYCGDAIMLWGNGTVANCQFNNCNPSYGAVDIFGGDTCSISGCQFNSCSSPLYQEMGGEIDVWNCQFDGCGPIIQNYNGNLLLYANVSFSKVPTTGYEPAPLGGYVFSGSSDAAVWMDDLSVSFTVATNDSVFAGINFTPYGTNAGVALRWSSSTAGGDPYLGGYDWCYWGNRMGLRGINMGPLPTNGLAGALAASAKALGLEGKTVNEFDIAYAGGNLTWDGSAGSGSGLAPSTGLPDWWIFKYFGTLGLTTTNLDANGRTLLYDYQNGINPLIHIVTQPLSQKVYRSDTVTFSVELAGNLTLAFQWTSNGIPVGGATSSSYTMNNVQGGDTGDYACIISDGTYSTVTSTAHLTILPNYTGKINICPITGSRQDYTFKSGTTYYISEPNLLYGHTTIEPGAVLKFDWYYGSSLQIMGSLSCNAEEYNPAVLTSVDDDSAGEYLGFVSVDWPEVANNNAAYVYISQTGNCELKNLQVRYADAGIIYNSGRLDVWNCQFIECNDTIVLLGEGATVNFHNALIAGCSVAVAANVNCSINGEHVTADTIEFWDDPHKVIKINLTNSIIRGSFVAPDSLATANVVFNPNVTNFQTVGMGNYYLAGNSPLHRAGTPNISPRLKNELASRTTSPPIPLVPMMQVTGDLTLFQQAMRYTNGLPDLGYYYPAMDYSVGYVPVWGNVTIEPGTVVGFRYDFINSTWSEKGFDLKPGASFVSLGLPGKPAIFVPNGFVQEKPFYVSLYGQIDFIPVGQAFFVPDFDLNDENLPCPKLDIQFSKFYAPSTSHHIWAGTSAEGDTYASMDSAMNLNVKNCSFFGGKISLGEADRDYDYGAANVLWANNLFNNVAISIDQSVFWLWIFNMANEEDKPVDFYFQAYNNLFKDCPYIHLETISSTAGNWIFKDNFFDKTHFAQNLFFSRPLDYDYNGYWPLLERELTYGGNAARLQPTETGDGFVDGQHEVTLSSPPPYQGGAFGNYYLTHTTPLYQAGSRTATDAGLAQYTTFANQSKDGSNQPVNIGLHYVAVTNSLPLDSDGDGVPDYVEAEHGTDLNNAMTDGVTNDIYNAAYDDVDLSGNGLVGRIKRAFGMNPLDASNPLIATQIVMVAESGLASLEVPVSYNTLTNIGRLKLVVDGNVASFQQCDCATNGHCLLVWNTTFDSPRQHYLQVQLLLNGQHHQGSTPDPTVLTGVGKLASFNSTNICQFDPFYSPFDSSGATLYAKTPACPDADYTIELQTESGAHIKTITNSTSTGEISEHWDLTDDNGNVVTNDTIKAVFNVTLLDPADGSLDFWLHRALYGNEDGNFTVAYTWDVDHEASGTMRDAIQYGIVDPLMAPLESGGSGSENPYPTTFNEYTWSGNLNGNPGYIPNQSAANNLVTNLSDVDTMDFYFDGHGSASTLGDDTRSQVAIFVTQISFALGNRFTPAKGMQCDHPYRFVFLNACDTANDHDWAHAFGILDSISPAQVAVRPLGAQAFLGWIGEPRAPSNDDEWNDMAQTFAVFFDAWQSGQYTLQDCIDIASKTHPYGSSYPITLNFPLGKKFFQVFGVPASGAANNFALKIYGYPLIMREGYATH